MTRDEEMEREVLEYKHVKTSENRVNSVMRLHQMFYWEVIGTQTVVSKESHIERDLGDYLTDRKTHVHTEERFTTVDFKRNKNIPNYEKINAVEQKYYRILGELRTEVSNIKAKVTILMYKKLSQDFDDIIDGGLEKPFIPYIYNPNFFERLFGLTKERIENYTSHYNELKSELAQFKATNNEILNV